MKTLVIGNQKGGVGKSTTAINLSAGLQRAGKKVCLLDFDPQSSCSVSMGLWHKEKNIYSVFQNKISMQDAVQETENFYFVSSDILLSKIERTFDHSVYFELVERLVFLNEFNLDYLVIDTPPNLGVLTFNALIAANHIITPLQTQVLALRALPDLFNTIELVQRRYNNGLNFLGIVFSLFDQRRKHDVEAMKSVVKEGISYFNTMIPNIIEIPDALKEKKTIFQYRPSGRGAKAFDELSMEILNGIEKG